MNSTPWIAATLLTTLPLAALAGSLRYDLQRGSVRALHLDAAEAPRFQGSPDQVAHRFLSRIRNLMNGFERTPRGADLLSTLGADLRIFELAPEGAEPEAETYRIDETRDLSFVRMNQTHAGLPVAGADLVVTVGRDGRVTSFQGGYAARAHEVGLLDRSPITRLSREDALLRVREAMGPTGGIEDQQAELCWWIDRDGALVKAYRVHVSTRNPLGSWRFFVDAARGRVLERTDLLIGSGTARGQVYMVNPLRDAELHPVTLERLGSTGKLKGQFVTVTNGKQDDIVAEDGNFVVGTDSTHFAEVQTYFHIDRSHEALKAMDPDYTGMDRSLPVEVHSPGNWQTRFDNAFYDPRRRALFFLDPQKLNDLHLEPAVAYHEYHHAVTDNIVPGFLGGQGRSLHEGYSDYFACTLTDDPEIGEWAVKPINRPNLRDLRKQGHYPEDMNGNPYVEGEIWASTCWDLRNRLGRQTADFLAHKSRFYLSTSSKFQDAYEGLLAADRDFLNGANQAVIREVFEARGFREGSEGSEGGAEAEALRLARFRRLHS